MQFGWCNTRMPQKYQRTMGYVTENLLANEEIAVEAEHHKIVFVIPAAFAVAGIFLVSNGSSFFGGALLLVAAWNAVKMAISFISDEMAITSERAVGKAGLISQSSLEMRNDFISGVAVDQSILGRILNYGTVEIRGDGADNVGFQYIKDPKDLRNNIQEHLADMEAEP
jgi:uncharacterized membrane protein YdbT with pleckstrin-like domain